MRINILQHTPNEGPGAIRAWAKEHGHELYIYHPYQFDGVLPSADTTDFLVILGGPMSPNDDLFWIKQERQLIKELLAKHVPIFGACFGAQQIAKTLGSQITKAPAKEVGWAPVYLKSTVISGLPKRLTALHWHEERFEIPKEAVHLFESALVKEQGFLVGDNVLGLQIHFDPEADDVREIALNDRTYPNEGNALKQSTLDILQAEVPAENKAILFKLLDFITQ